ncbi:hypothetical protein KCU89_g19249, partial [Aureobasidium melanogenum]
NMLNGITGTGHLTNGAHMNGFTNVQYPYDARSSGFQMNRISMNAPHMSQPHMNAGQMNGPHPQTLQMLGSQMDRLHLSGQQMNSHQMTASMPIHRGIPAQADPFVDSHPPVYGNSPSMAAANNYQPFVAAPQAAALRAAVGSPVSNASTAYTWGRGPQQTNNPVNIAQQPQTHAARMAEAIRSGALY